MDSGWASLETSTFERLNLCHTIASWTFLASVTQQEKTMKAAVSLRIEMVKQAVGVPPLGMKLAHQT